MSALLAKASHLDKTSIISTILVLIAAILLGWSNYKVLADPSRLPILRQPSFDAPDVFNNRLNKLKEVVAPLDKVLPADTPLRYLSETESTNQFECIQAAIAPRRISPEISSPYLLVVSQSDEWLFRQSALQGSRLLIKLPWRIYLFQVEASR